MNTTQRVINYTVEAAHQKDAKIYARDAAKADGYEVVEVSQPRREGIGRDRYFVNVIVSIK